MKKIFKSLILLSFVVFLISTGSVNAQVVDENNSWNNIVVSSIGLTGSNYYAQSFLADVNVISKFGVVIREIDAEGQLILSLAPDNGSGAPNLSALLYQGSLINPSTTGTWFYESGLDIPVTIGSKYWIVIDGYDNSGATGKSAIGVSGSYTDTGEGVFYSNTAGSSWSTIALEPLAIYVEGVASIVIDENNLHNGSVISSIGAAGSTFYAQSFYANVSMITRFGVYLTEIASEGEVLLSLAADNGSGEPNITFPLYEGTLKNPSTTGAWYYETGINIPVTVGSKYWVVIDGYNNTGATGRSSVGTSNNFTDTGEGMLYTNGDGVGSWNSLSAFKIAIEVEGIASATVDEKNGYTGNVVSSIGLTGSNFYAQSFYASVDTINTFGVVIKELDAEGEVILEIADDNGSGAPDITTPLYQGRMKNPTTNASWNYETGLNLPVTIGQKYWIVIDGYDNTGATGRSAIGISNSFTDTGDGMVYSNSGGIGSWSTISTTPLAIYVDGKTTTMVDEDNGYKGSNVSAIGTDGSDFYAQSFYANVNAITKFGVYLAEISTQGEVILSIAEDNGSGMPNVNSVLYQGSLLNPSTTGAWFYESGINIPLTIGTKYWVLIDGYNNNGATGFSAVGLSSNYTDTNEGILYSNAAGDGTWPSIPLMPIAIYVEGLRTALTVSDTLVDSGENPCFDATGAITVAGASTVELSSGSSSDFIAGYSVDFLPGFHAYPGSYVHAFISSGDDYCNAASAVLAETDSYKSTTFNLTDVKIETPDLSPVMKIYPNPTTGIFTVEMKNLAINGKMTVSNILGEVILQTDYVNVENVRFDLSGFKNGFYILQVNDGKTILTQKLLKN